MIQYINSSFHICKEVHQPSYTMTSMHHHNTNELYYLQHGNCTLCIEKKFYKITAGTFVLVPAGVQHKTTYLSDSSHVRIVIDFSNSEEEWFQKELGPNALHNLYSHKVIKVPSQKLAYVNDLLDKMIYEQDGVDELSTPYVKAYFYQIMLFLLRCQQYEENVVVKMNVSNHYIQKIIEYICNHYETDITLAKIAKEYHVSESSLSRTFKSFTGYRFKEYLIKVRIHASEYLLLNTDKNITEISALCGFGTANAYGDCFRKMKGSSPSIYRKQYQ